LAPLLTARLQEGSSGMRIRASILGFSLALALLAGSGLAQDKPPAEPAPAPAEAEAKAPAPRPADPKLARMARGIIEKALEASHAPEIFADLRRTLAEVYIPVMREMAQGGFPGAPEANAVSAAQLAKMLTFMDYLRKAGDDLDAALSEHREAIISDVSEQIARSANESAIGDLKRIMELPAVSKSMEAVYAFSKLVTGFTYDDSRKFSEFSAWVNSLSIDITKALPGTEDSGGKPVPSSRKVLKAQALVDELMRASHLDEIVADVERFALDVYAETAPLPGDNRENLIEKIEQFQFLYNMQKAVVLGVAPSVLAAAMSDEQLETLRAYLRSPAFVKAFELTRNAVKAATAYTKEDILEARKAFEDLDDKAKLRDKAADGQDQTAKEWDALVKKWRDILRDRISPDTRKGLEQSAADLKLDTPPI
jgi:hypothetical protein